EKTVTIKHNSDGSKSVPLQARINHNAPLSSDWSSTWNFKLDDIPRTSNPSVNYSSRAMGSAITISTNRKSTSFTHTLTYKFGNASGTIATNVGASYAWTIPMSLANQIPNSTSGTCTITCVTYSGGTRVGSSSVTFKATVPSSVKPSFDTITHSEYVSNVATKIGSYVKDLSRLSLAISGSQGAYSSTIKSYKITFNGKTYNSRTATTSVITSSGNLTITGTITDSRGRSASKSVTVNVLNYAPPKINSFGVSRINPDGTPNDMGVGANISWSGSFTSLNNKNITSVTIKSRPRGSSSWSTIHSYNAGAGGSIPAQNDIFTTYSELQSFEFRIEVKDQFNTTVALAVLPTGLVTMSWGKAGVGVGKVWERGALDVQGDFFLNNVPQGIVEMGS